MRIDFTNNPELQVCLDAWNAADPEARITWSHFDLANNTEVNDLDLWIAFLKDARVRDAKNEELQLYAEAQKAKLIQRATTHDKSVGTAQMINALGKDIDSGDNDKSGPIIIYSYVPLSPKEIEAPNIRMETNDIFERRGGREL